MRRLLAVALLCAGTAVPARGAAPPPAADLGWQARQLAALVRTSLTPDLLVRYREAAAAGQSELTYAVAGPDVDRDGVAELLAYETTWSQTADRRLVGSTTVVLCSGRTGKTLRTTTLPAALATPIAARVGMHGVSGMLLVGATQPTTATSEVRVVALDGPHVVYDRTVTSTDGLGQVVWGGTFDAVRGGGTDVVLTRRLLVDGHSGASGITSNSVTQVQAVLLDGADGSLTDVGTPDTGWGPDAAYYAAGDLDRDGADDLVLVRQGVTAARGSVTAVSSATGRPIWVLASAPVGDVTVAVQRTDVTGDPRPDVVLTEWFRSDNALLGTALAPVDVAAQPGVHVVVLDGATGALGWDRWVSASGFAFGALRLGPARELTVYGAVPVPGGWALRMSAVTGAGHERYHRDVVIHGRTDDLAAGFVVPAGDLDADGGGDAAYAFALFRGNALAGLVGGLMLTGPGTLRPFLGPLLASLDGRGADLYDLTGGYAGHPAYAVGARLVTTDGRTGQEYWHADVIGSALPGAFALPGAHGCAALVAVSMSPSAGRLWVAGLDARTGRVRWTRTLAGAAQPVTVRPGGRTATCH